MNERVPITILVVDDSEQALRQFELARPDLVLMDIVMPLMDGYEATRQIKRLSGRIWTPVIVLSSLSDEDDAIAGFGAGADDYIVRPLSFRLFAARIGALVKGVEADRRRAALVCRLQATGDAVIDGLVVCSNLVGVVVDCNAAAHRIFGCGESELVGRPLPLLPADSTIAGDATTALPPLNRTHDLLGRRGDGLIFPLEIGLTALPGDGRARLIGVVRDVTERKASEARLRESLEKLSLLYHSSEFGLALRDMSGRFVQCNTSFAGILDYTEDEVIGLESASVTPVEYLP